ncbi:uncharacterized protein LOC120344915 isoform X1 [Styela clava]
MSLDERNFDDLLSSKEVRTAEALDGLVEQININKERTIYDFLSHSGSEDFLWALIHMLSSKTIRIASNAAYVIGSLAETELGSHRILSLTHGKRAVTILEDLTKMLTVEDAETVMNSAGTLGTLAETEEGRQWMLSQQCIEETMINITFLLGSDNHWTASNSALVLARITISESGSQAILDHPRSKYILTRLIQSLGNDTAGRGMNAAFAIGRLLDTKIGKERLLYSPDAEKMIMSLCRMLTKGDMGGAKNACFAISCMATDVEGNQRVLSNNLFQDVVNRLILLLSNTDDAEAAWFAAMTLRTISTHKQGVLRLRQNNDVESALMKVKNKPRNSKELNEEIDKTLMYLKKLDQPDPPVVEVINSTSIQVQWKPVNTNSGLQITYKLFNGNKVIYKGLDLQRTVNDLQPFTSYSFKVRASTLGDDSPFSDIVPATTDEDVPSAPTFLRIIGATPTQLRLTWNSPEHRNGILKGYTIYLGEKIMDVITEMSYIISRLTPATRYIVHVCASTSKGLGERATVETVTDELGAHAPEKPNLTVIGRNEIHVAWMPPAVPLGRFFRYELCMNDRVVYQGTDKVYRATGLTPDTDYVFVVVAITSEGKCTSEPTKKRTLKDKSQIEPGHHKLKTHSFMAKEFQTMQEKSKSQSHIILLQKNKSKLKKKHPTRPSSTMSSSNISDTSGVTHGTWAQSGGDSLTDDLALEYDYTNEINKKPIKKFRNPAILGGASVKKITSSNLSSHESKPSSGDVIHSSHIGSSGDEKGVAQETKPDITATDKGGKSQPKELAFNKENIVKHIKTSTARNRARLHRGHVMMKGKKVLKSDKELLAEMSGQNHQKSASHNWSKPPETGQKSKPAPYYPDIVSAIRKQYPAENITDDLLHGKLERKSPESPDSLDAEPGTARLNNENDLDNSAPKTEVPPIKQSLPHYLTRERHINEYQLHEYSRHRSLPYRSHQDYSAPRLSTKSTNLYANHIVLKSTPSSKYGLRYSHLNNNTDTSESSQDAESAFQSLSHIHESTENHSSHRAHIHKPLHLKPLTSERLNKSSSERNLNQEYSQDSAVSNRLKTPPKGYWSDHDISPPKGRKKATVLTPINYKTFQGAHRPTKSIRLESPLVTGTDTWFVNDSLPSGDNNRYKFVPTQLRTQPANLPIHGQASAKISSRFQRHLKLEDYSGSNRRTLTTAGGHTPSPPTQKRHSLKNKQHASGVPNNSSHKLVSHDRTKPYMFRKSIDANHDLISGPSVKPGSILDTLSHRHGYEGSSQRSSAYSHTQSNLQSANTTSIPHTILSPLTPSDLSTSATPTKHSSTRTTSSKSPRLRMTSSTSPFYHTNVPTATGYAISPSSSLSPIHPNDQSIGHLAMQRQMALVPGGGDLV